MMRNHAVSPKKVEEINYLKKLVETYKVVGLAHVTKMPAKSLHTLRTQLRGEVVIHMTKKSLFKRAFQESKKENLDELGKSATGITALLFTNMNPIALAKYLKSKAVKGPAKPGDIAPIDIEVKAGDTKISPGPIISELNQNLKLPTMIKNGTIHIRTDTITHKKGELITDKAAQLLTRLGIEPMNIEMDFYAAWEDGSVLPDAVLHLDEEALLGNVRLAASEAMNVALSLGVIVPETITPLISKAQRSAIAVATSLPIFIPDLLPNYISKAVVQASFINASVFGGSESAAPVKEAAAPTKKEESKKDDDLTMGEGIASFFD